MRAGALICGLALCLTSACAADKGIHPPRPTDKVKDCKGSGQCDVQVSVSCALNFWPCWIEVDYDVVKTRGADKRPVFFALVSNDYMFPRDGIVFPPNSALTCKPLGEKGTEFKCDNDGRLGEYKYTIKLVPKGGAPSVKDKDPFVYNE